MRLLYALPPLLSLLLAMPTTASAGFDHGHALWREVLAKHVDGGQVGYRELHADTGKLDEYLRQVGAVDAEEYGGWTRRQSLAYWINAYNAYTLKTILDHYPLKRRGLMGRRFPANSIRQIPGVWDKLAFRAGGEQLTLNDMEHKKMRDELKEPRIHFAIVCASIGCPALQGQAFTAAKLEAQLDAAARQFVRDRAKVKLDAAGGVIHLSKLFDWFSGDFAKSRGVSGYGELDGVLSFCAK